MVSDLVSDRCMARKFWGINNYLQRDYTNG